MEGFESGRRLLRPWFKSLHRLTFAASKLVSGKSLHRPVFYDVYCPDVRDFVRRRRLEESESVILPDSSQ
ncbi:hypothetical protein RBH26_13865 [Natronolimnohabitans sp. A-GB9]|uniref:hypothetical protein n=1 Tax=Natronolimnohabitans sp. A-GB9 TaxID=3069757 RepID=UPI0027AF9B05|nr:hypothetical protein [Natronolimnohabitans sp. A-GB9]MDQ2051564.1 hypothetical protein [Natronolimnohabitans sp. A-GB9]